MPARQSLHLADRPFSITASVAAAGLALTALASLGGLWLDGRLFFEPNGNGRHSDVLLAALQALFFVMPGAIVVSTYLRLRVTARALMASMAIGFLTGGLVAMCLLPFFTFLALTDSEKALRGLATFVIPAGSLVATALVPIRVVSAFESTHRARGFAVGFGVTVLAAFFIRQHI